MFVAANIKSNKKAAKIVGNILKYSHIVAFASASSTSAIITIIVRISSALARPKIYFQLQKKKRFKKDSCVRHSVCMCESLVFSYIVPSLDFFYSHKHVDTVF